MAAIPFFGLSGTAPVAGPRLGALASEYKRRPGKGFAIRTGTGGLGRLPLFEEAGLWKPITLCVEGVGKRVSNSGRRIELCARHHPFSGPRGLMAPNALRVHLPITNLLRWLRRQRRHERRFLRSSRVHRRPRVNRGHGIDRKKGRLLSGPVNGRHHGRHHGRVWYDLLDRYWRHHDGRLLSGPLNGRHHGLLNGRLSGGLLSGGLLNGRGGSGYVTYSKPVLGRLLSGPRRRVTAGTSTHGRLSGGLLSGPVNGRRHHGPRRRVTAGTSATRHHGRLSGPRGQRSERPRRHGPHARQGVTAQYARRHGRRVNTGRYEPERRLRACFLFMSSS